MNKVDIQELKSALTDIANALQSLSDAMSPYDAHRHVNELIECARISIKNIGNYYD